jgi:hypothetical protein
MAYIPADAQAISDTASDLSNMPASIDLINHELLSGDVVPGARLCTRCQHIMPSHDQYTYHDCCSCRLRARLKRMREVERRGNDVPLEATLSDEEDIINTMIEQNTVPCPGSGRCTSHDCGVLVFHGALECWQCTTRDLKSRRQRGRTRGEISAPVSESNPRKLLKNCSSLNTTSCSKQDVERPVN